MEKIENCQGSCPKCYSTDITYIDDFTEEDYICYVGYCNKCNTKFREWYSLHYAETIYEDKEEGNNNENL